MIKVSDITTLPPKNPTTELQREVYNTFERLGIRFERVDNDPAISMEDCAAINSRFGVKTVKTLLLTNRQQTVFYLFVTEGDKSFSTRDFGHALSIPRVSFAPAEKLAEIAHTVVGATTVLSVLLDRDKRLNVVIDKAVTANEYFCCTDGTTTCYLMLRTADVLRLIEYAGYQPQVIEV